MPGAGKDFLGDLIEVGKRLGPAPDVVLPELNTLNVRCACNKLVPATEATHIWSPILMADAVEPICPGCRPDFKGTARLVCAACRSVIGWLPPQRDAHGFRIESDKCYHVRHCRVCKKGLQGADILEMVLFYKSRGIPYESTEDLPLNP